MTPLASKKCGPLPLDHHLYRFLYEQRRRFGTGAWHLFDTYDVIASSTGISTKRDNVHELAPLNRRSGLLTVSHPRR